MGCPCVSGWRCNGGNGRGKDDKAYYHIDDDKKCIDNYAIFECPRE